MHSNRLSRRQLFRAVCALGCAVLLAPVVHAGPPLICHPYAIGTAKSLPGGSKDSHWLGVDKSYDRKNVAADTLALLTPESPIIVRMETLRRAAIYATAEMRGWQKDGYTAEDRAISLGLLEKLQARAKEASSSKRALALFDAGFFAETLRQTNMDPGIDGYALIAEAAKLRSGDPEIEFALALASTSAKPKQRDDHLARARAAAKPGTPLAANLASHFGKS
jgi:hypothetical protein